MLLAIKFWFKSLRERKLYPFLVIIGAGLAAWGPFLAAGFMNDDIQMIGAPPASVTELFSPFRSLNVWEIYWRPVTALWLKGQAYLFGLEPFIFRLTTLILFIAAALLFFRLAKKLGLNRNASLLASLIFILVPSHELNAGWISANGDLLAAIFLILSFGGWLDFFRRESPSFKGMISPTILLLSAMLSKELAYAGVALPLIAYLSASNERKRFSSASYGVIINALSVALILTYRTLFIGSDLFSAPHIQDVTAKSLVQNFLLYLPASFITPDIMEVWYFKFTRPEIMLSVLLIAAVSSFTLIRVWQHRKEVEKSIVVFGLLWFIIFIVPVTPVFMRWYPFTASVGLIIAAGYSLEMAAGKYKIVIALSLAGLAVYNSANTISWYHAGELYKEQIGIIRDEVDPAELSDTLYMAALPDKMERVAVMKIGINETLEYALGRKPVPNRAILRCEIAGHRERVRIVSQDSSGIELELKNGRFILEGMRSKAVINNEAAVQRTNDYDITVRTDARDDLITSRAVIKFKDSFRNKKLIVLSK